MPINAPRRKDSFRESVLAGTPDVMEMAGPLVESAIAAAAATWSCCRWTAISLPRK